MTKAAAELPTPKGRKLTTERRTEHGDKAGTVPGRYWSKCFPAAATASLTDAGMKERARGHKAGANTSPGSRCACRTGHQPLGYTPPAQTLHTTGGRGASSCRPRNDSKRLQMRPLPINIIPVISQNTLWSWKRTELLSVTRGQAPQQ